MAVKKDPKKSKAQNEPKNENRESAKKDSGEKKEQSAKEEKDFVDKAKEEIKEVYEDVKEKVEEVVDDVKEDLESEGQNTEDVEKGKVVAIVSYITWIGLLIAFLVHYLGSNKTKFGAFHLRQSLGLYLTLFVVLLLNILPFLGQILYVICVIIVIILLILGFIFAITGKAKTVPVLGPLFQNWFKSIQ